MFNPLNAKLNPICHQLVLLRAGHIFHVSGLRVNSDLNIDTRLHALYKHSYSIQIFSDEKPDDGQCWPKHVVLSFLSFSNKHQLDIQGAAEIVN